MIIRFQNPFVLPDTNDNNVILIDFEVDRTQFFKDLCEQSKDKKNKLTYVTPDCKIRYHSDDVECLSYPFVVWDISPQKILDVEIKYNFISLNSSPKSHRLLLITDLKDYEYFEYSFFPFPHGPAYAGGVKDLSGIIGLSDISDKLALTLISRIPETLIKPRILTELSGFPLKFDSFEVKDLNNSKWFLNNTCPLEYYQSNIDIVTESYIKNGTYFTEKTLKALSNKKPFLILGDQYMHASLKKLGFELFEEIFDYEFDSQPNFEIRYEMMIKQILRYINDDPQKLSQIIIGLKDKLEHNYELLKKIQRERETLFADLWNPEEDRTISDDKLLNILRSKQNDYIS